MSLLVKRWSAVIQQRVCMDHTTSITADGADHHDFYHIYASLLLLVKYHPPDK